MNINHYKFFLRYIKGKWLLQENLFLLKSNKHKKNTNIHNYELIYNYLFYKNKLDNNKKLEDFKIITELLNSNINNLSIQEFSKNKNQEYFLYLKFIRKGLLKNATLDYQKKIKQEEYIYLVNSNIMIIITLAKSFSGIHLGVKISSYIRKN